MKSNTFMLSRALVFSVVVNAFFCLNSCQFAPAGADAPAFSGKRVLFLGDSITQDGTYVTFIEYYLDKLYPTQKFDIISIGLASETASGLSEKAHPFPRPWVQERLWAALDTVKPNIVVACYGMNDGIYHPQSQERMVAFQNGILSLIAKSKAAGARVILLTPPPFDPVPVRQKTLQESAPDFSYLTPFEGYDTVLQDYGRWEMTLPEMQAQVIDIHKPLADYVAQQRRSNPDFALNADGIHPSPAGHLRIAAAVLNAIGVPFRADDEDLSKMAVDPLYQLVASRRQRRSDGWLPYIGYTRDGIFKTNSITQTEQEAAAAQIQIDRARNEVAPTRASIPASRSGLTASLPSASLPSASP